MLSEAKSRYAGKTKILLLSLVFLVTVKPQTVYEVQPGTKGNEIKLTFANVSETDAALNVEIKSPLPVPILSGNPPKGDFRNVTFSKESQLIERINPGEEKEVTFEFDINRNAPVNKKDTIDFLITDANGLMITKSIIFSYTGPKEFKLEQNFPNPFNPTTTIQYQLPQDAKVILKIYDILGSEAATLVNEEQQPGYYEIQFNVASHSGDGRNLASGMYVYRLQANDYVSVKKMMVLK